MQSGRVVKLIPWQSKILQTTAGLSHLLYGMERVECDLYSKGQEYELLVDRLYSTYKDRNAISLKYGDTMVFGLWYGTATGTVFP